ncbi:MAG: polysulfide reductase NrfD, partial [Eggerthellaceae bacterium]|nr:polysulfide reductase NrfD [Eggerthellaceae bacterium]
MKNHYWKWPIALYLFLGGLGGGIICLSWIFDLVFGVGPFYVMSVFIGVCCMGVGCVFLVFELGQPTVFLRVFTTATAIIKWGAVLLSVSMISGFIYFISYFFVQYGSPQNLLQTICLWIAGITGACVMVYTGVLLASLKAHSFWATPALPVLFTISALSTGCAALSYTGGIWPYPSPIIRYLMGEIIHATDTVLIIIEMIVLLLYVLMFLGAGNETAKKVALRWVKGSLAPWFWAAMMGGGLALPLVLYFIGGVAASYVAPAFVLAGGLLLRFLVVYSDDREPLPGEVRFYSRLPKGEEKFLTAWTNKEKLYR